MLIKEYLPNIQKPLVRVSFMLPDSLWASAIQLVGDFNEWDEWSNPFHRERNGQWCVTVELEPNHVYEFRYLLDHEYCINEAKADGYKTNSFGSDNGLVSTDIALCSVVSEVPA